MTQEQLQKALELLSKSYAANYRAGIAWEKFNSTTEKTKKHEAECAWDAIDTEVESAENEMQEFLESITIPE